jgi:hypothetical protein
MWLRRMKWGAALHMRGLPLQRQDPTPVPYLPSHWVQGIRTGQKRRMRTQPAFDLKIEHLVQEECFWGGRRDWEGVKLQRCSLRRAGIFIRISVLLEGQGGPSICCTSGSCVVCDTGAP